MHSAEAVASNAPPPIPVVIFTGYLGAGKTTIIQRITPHLISKGERILTVVNDLSPDNTDVFAFQQSAPSHALASAPDSSQQSEVAALSGGCVCCNLLGDLVETLLKAYEGRVCTYIILECTGVADPAPVVATLSALPALAGKVVVDAVVTVVNAASLASVTEETEPNGAGEVSVDLDVARSDVMGGGQARGANLVLINNWESLLAKGGAASRTSRMTVTPRALTQWPVLLRDFCRDANPDVRVELTRGGHFDFLGTVWRKSLFASDGTLPFYLRAYAAAGKTVGDFGGGPEEEAAELRQMGLRLYTFQSPALLLSTAKLRAAVTGKHAPGKRLLRRVWRSKGFFDAVDDERVHTTGGEAEPLAPRQFRWQSVDRRFDYGEVLPPYVVLTAASAGGVAGDDARRDARLTCRIVFMGNFEPDELKAEAEAFFASIAV